jgi:hypothetical protein
MCGGCSSDNNQTNVTFQVWGAGMISLGVAAGNTFVFRVGFDDFWMAAVVVDRDGDGDGGGGGDSSDGNGENDGNGEDDEKQ